MMTSTQLRDLETKRNAIFWLCIFGLALATALFFIIVPQFIPVTSADTLPYPEEWIEDSEPEEDPCVSPAQRRYFEELQKKD